MVRFRQELQPLTGIRVFSAILLVCLAALTSAQCFPDSVTSFSAGANYGHGLAYFPANGLGPPSGTTNPQVPNYSESDIFSLGTGGSIILEFSTNRILDGPGPDFTVFENPVQPNSHPEQTFADTAIVSASEDGVLWHSFPCDLVSTATSQLYLKSNYIGFAGVQPTYSSIANGISPFDPTVSGGDQFDLSAVNLPHARFVRITDSGDSRFRPSYDFQGDLITDFGNLVDPDPTVPDNGRSSGFDLDAVAALHSEPWSQPASVSEWGLYD